MKKPVITVILLLTAAIQAQAETWVLWDFESHIVNKKAEPKPKTWAIYESKDACLEAAKPRAASQRMSYIEVYKKTNTIKEDGPSEPSRLKNGQGFVTALNINPDTLRFDSIWFKAECWPVGVQPQ